MENSQTQNQITQTQPQNRGRLVILNGLPLNSMPRSRITLEVTPIAVQELAEWVQQRIAEGYRLIHFVRHVGTVAALRAAGIPLESPNNGLYQYTHGDVIVVISLRTPQRGTEQANVDLSDLDAWLVEVRS